MQITTTNLSSDTCKRGVVENISNNCVNVLIERNSACKDCHAKSVCLASDMSTISVAVETPIAKHFNVGDSVQVTPRFSVYHAIFYAFVLPLLIVVSSLLIARIYLDFNSALQLLIAFLTLLLYYLLLSLGRSYFKTNYTYEIRKIP